MRNPILCMLHAGCAGGLLLFSVIALPIDMDTAVNLALAHDEKLKAMERRVSSLSEGAVADGELPDPQIFVGAQGVPIDDPLDADMMTMYRLGLRQRFPAGRTREFLRQRGDTRAQAVQLEIQARRLEVGREARMAWLDWTSAAHSLELAQQSAEAFEALLEVTESRYRSGTGRQRDINQARLELALLQRRIIQRRTDLDDAASRLQRWTGHAPDQSNAADFPDWPEPEPIGHLEQRLPAHPMLVADDRRIEVGILNTRLAKQAFRPEWMVEAGYAHQRATDPMTMSRQSDKLFAMLTFSVPLFTANRQDRRLSAAREELEALNHDRGLKLQDLSGRLQQQLSRWHRNTEHLQLIESMVLTEAEATVEATLSAYRADRATFDELVRSRLALLEQQLQLIDIRRARQAAAIELNYLTAEPLQ